MAEVDRMLDLVEEFLPLGKDEWERLAGFYNVTRTRGWPEREYESLRRKFKVLYSTRKPTGVSEMPPHIKRAKERKDAVDDKANVVVMDDGADDEQEDSQPDFSFEMDPDDEVFSSTGGAVGDVHAAADAEYVDDLGQVGAGTSTHVNTHEHRTPAPGGFQDLLAPPFAEVVEDAVSKTPRPAPTPHNAPNTRAGTRSSVSAVTSTSTPQPSMKQTTTRSRSPAEPSRYQTSSNRLGGVDLTSMRDATGVKRNLNGDNELLEASYAKSKRIRAAKATTALKTKLDSIERSSMSSGGSMLETILLLREENERKAEIRRAEEDQRRHDEAAVREAHELAEKAEREERRRQDRLDMEERARRDKEEARARTQELILLIGSLIKK
ncbi:hypothetical protein DVH05_009144 [Phytophthora capsici]|nr:hypothetical protein DVH05_009144 [Phytophthora capsici]